MLRFLRAWFNCLKSGDEVSIVPAVAAGRRPGPREARAHLAAGFAAAALSGAVAVLYLSLIAQGAVDTDGARRRLPCSRRSSACSRSCGARFSLRPDSKRHPAPGRARRGYGARDAGDRLDRLRCCWAPAGWGGHPVGAGWATALGVHS